MLIRCPKCQTGFNLAAEKIPAGGAKLKCSACTHSFRVRVGSDDEPEYFYKRGEQPPPGWGEEEESGTMVGSPSLGMGLEEESEKTQFGFNARSKSAEHGYNPFPLAAADDDDDDDDDDGGNSDADRSEAEDHGNSTQLFGGAGNTIDISDEIDLVMAIEEHDDDSDRTSIGRAGIVPPPDESNDRTQLGAVGRAGNGSNGPPQIPGADAAGNRTQALGSGVDLFDGDLFDDDDAEPRGAAPIDDYDPFGDAFESPMGDVGLLMPSTPFSDDSSPRQEPPQTGLDEISAVGMSEESLFLGGNESEFGPADELVDPSFGMDVPGFDAASGAVDQIDRPPKKKQQQKSGSRGRPSGEFAQREGNIELDDVQPRQTVEKKQRRSGQASVAPSRTPAREPAATEEARPRQKIRSDYAAHRVGATSPVRRAFDIVFITLIVLVAGLGFIAFRAGGLIDFSRFGHMLEVAFEGEEFVPREDWKQVVEVSTAPPPEEPLRLRDVRAFDATVGDDRVFVVLGKIRNYSMKTFQGLELRAEIVDPDNKILAEQTEPGGRSLDLAAVKGAKSADDLQKAIETKIPDIGKEGTISFAFVFDDVPATALDEGAFSYRVALTK